MINTVVFDLGGVLVDFHPEKGMRELGFSKEAVNAFKERIFSGFWEECDSMQFTNAEIRRIFKEKLPEYEEEVDRLWDNLPAVTGMRPYSMEWIRKLKEMGLKLYVLSNYGNAAFEINSKIYDFLPLMDGKLISYEIRLGKPDRRIYEELIKKYGIHSSEAVFIDDRKENIDGALAVGMQGIVFENYDQANKQLMNLIQG